MNEVPNNELDSLLRRAVNVGLFDKNESRAIQISGPPVDLAARFIYVVVLRYLRWRYGK